DVQALVDPGHQQRLRALGLRAHLPTLTRVELLGGHQQGADAERDLGEGVGAGGSPAVHADVGLHLEGLPPGGAHPRSPKRDWRIAVTAGPAVSVRRMRGPSDTTVNPRARASSTSAFARPPSGPTSTTAERGDPAAPRTTPSGVPPASHRHSARSTGRS